MEKRNRNILHYWQQFNPLNSVLGSLIVAVVVIGGAFYYGAGDFVLGETTRSNGEEVNSDEEYQEYLVPSPLPQEPVEIPIEGQPSIGSTDAPILFVEFVDYQCPYCKEFSSRIVSELLSEYVEQGLVQYVVKDFPLNGHANAWPAAYAANCIAELADDEAYFAYHDLLFQYQEDWDIEMQVIDMYAEYAANVGVEEDDFVACYGEESSKMDIEQDIEDGKEVGVNGTPMFFVNGKPFVGLPPAFNDVKLILDQELETQ